MIDLSINRNLKNLNVHQNSLIWLEMPEIIERQARRENSIIIGGKAIQAHLSFYGRPSYDYDILTSNPSQSSRRLERKLDSKAGENSFYRTRAKGHAQTIKVIYVGEDGRPMTQDDQTVADYSPFRPTRTTLIGGNYYAQLSSIIREKQNILKQKELAYRHQKDFQDIQLIKQITAIQRTR